MEGIAIEVKNVSKSFKIPHEKTSSLKAAALSIFKKKTYSKLDTAKDISFEVKDGEFFGIIGRNGSGKSTMLKMLAGIYLPDKGKLKVSGRLSPFLELGVGFNPELSARDNIFLNGAILGLTRKEISEKFDEIVAFSELEEFIDQKLKNFSSGMQVRLAFSVAIHAHADILLIDEVLAVGDASFQKKCLDKFQEFKNQRKTVVFVSHSMGYVKDFCDRTAVINDGELVFIGNTERAVDLYNKLNLDRTLLETKKYNLSKEEEHLGSGGAKITHFEVFNEKKEKSNHLRSWEEFSVEVEVEYKKKVINPSIGVMFRKNPAENLYGLNNYFERVNLGLKSEGVKEKIIFKDKMPLGPGDYLLSFYVSDAKSSTEYEELDIMDSAVKVTVSSDKEVWGLISNTVKISREE